MQKQALVIDKHGHKVELVVVVFEPILQDISAETNVDTDTVSSSDKKDEQTNKYNERVLYYNMKEGETLVYDDLAKAFAMLKPRWTGKAWEETATPEEINAKKTSPVETLKQELQNIEAELRRIFNDEQFEMWLGPPVKHVAMAMAFDDSPSRKDVLIARRNEINASLLADDDSAIADITLNPPRGRQLI